MYRHIHTAVLVAVALLAPLVPGCARRAPSSADAAAAPAPPVATDDAALGATPTPDVPESSDATATPDASAGPEDVPCRPAWVLPTNPAWRIVDGALAGGEAGLLVDMAAGARLLLVAGEYADTKAVALPAEESDGSPDAGTPLVALVGAVASYGDRFLVAWGRPSADGLELRLRAVMPDGRILPANAPGQPGAAGGPVLNAVPSKPGASPAVMLHAAAGGIVLAVSWDGADGSAYVVLTSTGAPSSDQALGWSLAPALPGAASRWQAVPALADSIAYRYVGPFGAKALAVDDERGVTLLVVPGMTVEPLRFADGWVPAPGEPVWFSPQSVLRLVPGSTPPRAVAYNGRGEVAARLTLPEGDEPLAVARDARSLLVRDAAGAVRLCGIAAAERTPRTVDPGAALASPSSGVASCGP